MNRLELKIRNYNQLINDLPKRFHSLNILHLSLSNDLRSNILKWPVEQFSRINLINDSNEIPFESPPTSSAINANQTPTTPLTSLKQLLGIRTQDVTILEPSFNHDILSTEENQRY